MRPLTADALRKRAEGGPPGLHPPPFIRPRAPEDVLGKVTEHEHVCGVGGRPKPGQSVVRVCRCGQFYLYGGWGWQKVSPRVMRRMDNGVADDWLTGITGDYAERGARMGGPGRFVMWLSCTWYSVVRYLAAVRYGKRA